MFGIGPNPVTKNITYTMTLKTDTTAKTVSLAGTRLMIMRERGELAQGLGVWSEGFSCNESNSFG